MSTTRSTHVASLFFFFRSKFVWKYSSRVCVKYPVITRRWPLGQRKALFLASLCRLYTWARPSTWTCVHVLGECLAVLKRKERRSMQKDLCTWRPRNKISVKAGHPPPPPPPSFGSEINSAGNLCASRCKIVIGFLPSRRSTIENGSWGEF